MGIIKHKYNAVLSATRGEREEMRNYIDLEQLKEKIQDFSDWCRDGRKQGVDFVLDCVLPNMKTAKLKRVETLTDEALNIYIKTLNMANIYGVSDWECGCLDCDMCPFNHDKDCCKTIYTEKNFKEWLKWGLEEVQYETDI